MVDRDGRVRDQLGRGIPQQLNPLVLFHAIPGLARQFSAIPARAWRHDSREVQCPCGDRPRIERGEWMTRCGCGRFYLLASGEVFVANSPVRKTGANVD